MIVDHELSLSIAERISVGPQQDWGVNPPRVKIVNGFIFFWDDVRQDNMRVLFLILHPDVMNARNMNRELQHGILLRESYSFNTRT